MIIKFTPVHAELFSLQNRVVYNLNPISTACAMDEISVAWVEWNDGIQLAAHKEVVAYVLIIQSIQNSVQDHLMSLFNRFQADKDMYFWSGTGKACIASTKWITNGRFVLFTMLINCTMLSHKHHMGRRDTCVKASCSSSATARFLVFNCVLLPRNALQSAVLRSHAVCLTVRWWIVIT